MVHLCDLGFYFFKAEVTSGVGKFPEDSKGPQFFDLRKQVKDTKSQSISSPTSSITPPQPDHYLLRKTKK